VRANGFRKLIESRIIHLLSIRRMEYHRPGLVDNAKLYITIIYFVNYCYTSGYQLKSKIVGVRPEALRPGRIRMNGVGDPLVVEIIAHWLLPFVAREWFFPQRSRLPF